MRNSLSIDVLQIKKNSNDFSFISTVFDLGVNQDYTASLTSVLNTNIVNEQTNIWHTLSAIGQEVGDAFQTSINNFIDNISNVDLCNVKQLQSLITFFGINYSVFDTIDDFPLEIKKLIDILSIPREYLNNKDKVSRQLLSSVYYNCKFLSNELSNSYTASDTITNYRQLLLRSIDEGGDLCAAYRDISSNWHYSTNNISNGISVTTVDYINDIRLDDFISTVYYDYLNSQLCATYNDLLCTIIYEKLSTDILLSSTFDINSGNDTYAEDLVKYNIDKTFDLEKSIYALKTNMSSESDFSIYEYSIIQKELSCRAKAYNVQENQTRNKYYRELKFKEYYDFVENQNTVLSDLFRMSKTYDIDDQYFVVKANENKNSKNRLLSADNDFKIAHINDNYVKRVALTLLDITNAVRDIRQSTKIQCQKNFMKGTFLLLSYVINEYLKNNTLDTIRKIHALSGDNSNLTFNTEKNTNELVTYVDPINYFNIATTNDLSNTEVNTRYWEVASGVSAIAAIDNTNIFATPPTVNSNNFAFTLQQIELFYKNILNANLDKISLSNNNIKPLSTYNERLVDFLACIFDIGADKTKADLSGNPITYVDEDSKLKDYKDSLFYNYIGLSNGYSPYYYHTNTVHPSYLIHPYLSNFMEQTNYSYPIKNLATVVIDDVLQELCANIDSYIDDHGYIINEWKNPLVANSDYVTIYENSNNINDKNFKDPVVDYEGLFYPYAVVQAYTYNTAMINALISSEVSCNISRKDQLSINYYYGLDLTETECYKIARQLSTFLDILLEEATRKNPYCIYKYCLDMYGNAYILLKKCKSTDSYLTLKTAPGVLWIRYHNHPIAFPAYVVKKDDISQLTSISDNDLAQLLIDEDLTNNYILYAEVIEIGHTYRDLKTYNIQDFYIANNKQNIIFNIVTGSNQLISAIVPCVCKSIKTYNEYDAQTEYRFNVLSDNNYGQVDTLEIESNLSGYSFDNYFNYDTKIGAIYHKMIDSKNAEVIIPYVDISKQLVTKDRITANIKIDEDVQITEDAFDIAVDTDANGNINVAYVAKKSIRDNGDNKQLSNFIRNNTKYSDISSYLRYDQSNYIVTLQYFFGNSNVATRVVLENNSSKYNSSHFYNTYTDNGFFGLLESKDSNTTNNLSTSILTYDSTLSTVQNSELQNRGILKFLLLGPKCNNPIDYKFVLPVRMLDGYFNNVSDVLSLASQFDLHYDEDASSYATAISSNHPIYDPIEILRLMNDNHPTLRILEVFFKYVKENVHNRLFSEIVQLPYLWFAKVGNVVQDIPLKYINPNAYSHDEKASEDNFVINIYPNTTPISVSWYKTDNGIQLDFNTYYYNNFKGDNYFNEKRIFLSLEKPGQAGFLNVFKNTDDLTSDNVEPEDDAIYYIKNISDDKYPKFILSSTNKLEKSYYNEYLVTENSLSNVITEDSYYRIILD